MLVHVAGIAGSANRNGLDAAMSENSFVRMLFAVRFQNAMGILRNCCYKELEEIEPDSIAFWNLTAKSILSISFSLVAASSPLLISFALLIVNMLDVSGTVSSTS